MKKNWIPLLVLVAMLAIACGGGGGGGGGSNGGSGGGLTNIRVEAVLASNPNQIIDPMNIQVGDTVQFQVVGYTSAGVRQVLPATNWSTTDTGNLAGFLSADGVLSATNASAGIAYTASGKVGASTYSSTYAVRPAQALVTGTVLDSNGQPVSGAAVVFYNSSLVEVSRVKTAYNGTFRASVPNTAREINLDPVFLPKAKYFRSFVYANKRYTALEKSCSAAIPTPVNGTTTSLGVITVDAAVTGGFPNPPPPPPDGCS